MGLDGKTTKALNEARTKYLGKEDMPASTLLGIQALIHPNLKIEIEAIAVTQEHLGEAISEPSMYTHPGSS